MRYNPALTGLRGVAILPVIAFHCKVPGFIGGFYGVDLFFVLSGFLITGILRDELADTGGIDLVHFYWNRILRLTPPLFLCLAILLGLGLADSVKVLVAATYLTDLYAPFVEHPYGAVSHTWSLAVEEHFYLIWPIALLAILRTKRPVFWIVALFVLATLWRAVTLPFMPGEMTYLRLDARLSGLLLGSAVALVSDRITTTALTSWLSIYGLLIAMFGVHIYTAASFAVLTAVELASAALLLAALQPDTIVHRALSQPWLVRIGLWSYGLYLWHYPIAYTLRLDYPWLVTLAATVAFSFPLAMATHHFIEVPIARYRQSRMAEAGAE